MFVNVQFQNRFKPGDYTQKEYTYRCDFPVQVGDMVEVPVSTQAGEVAKTVRVSAVDVPEYAISAEASRNMRSVIRPAEYDETLFDQDQQAEPVNLPEVSLSGDIIVIRQLPVIEDQLRSLRATVEHKVSEALSLAVTEDTVKAVKTVRAALNKEYKDLEARRKQVKLAILEPYDRFEATYRECIGDLYTEADQKLREKIDAVENGVKEQKREALREYFEEYRRSVYLAGEPMADFDAWCGKVNKTASDKSLRTAAKAFLDGLRSDLDSIATMENADEIFVEYKVCRELSKAISTVNERARLKEEERRRRADEAAERAAREAREREAMAKVEAAAAAARPEPLAPPVEAPAPAPAASRPVDPDKVYPKVNFSVFNVTRRQLEKLVNFMKEEGINYGK